MTMSRETIRTYILVCLCKMCTESQRTSCATAARFGINDYIRLDDTCSQSREQCENGGSGITTRVCTERSALDNCAITLALSIHCSFQQGRRWMCMPVPLHIKSNVPQTK